MLYKQKTLTKHNLMSRLTKIIGSTSPEYTLITDIRAKSMYNDREFIERKLLQQSNISNIDCIKCGNNNEVNMCGKLEITEFLCSDCKDSKITTDLQITALQKMKQIKNKMLVNSSIPDKILNKMGINRGKKLSELEQRQSRLKI